MLARLVKIDIHRIRLTPSSRIKSSLPTFQPRKEEQSALKSQKGRQKGGMSLVFIPRYQRQTETQKLHQSIHEQFTSDSQKLQSNFKTNFRCWNFMLSTRYRTQNSRTIIVRANCCIHIPRTTMSIASSSTSPQTHPLDQNPMKKCTFKTTKNREKLNPISKQLKIQ